jgi:hypothetical protein
VKPIKYLVDNFPTLDTPFPWYMGVTSCVYIVLANFDAYYFILGFAALNIFAAYAVNNKMKRDRLGKNLINETYEVKK